MQWASFAHNVGEQNVAGPCIQRQLNRSRLGAVQNVRETDIPARNRTAAVIFDSRVDGQIAVQSRPPHKLDSPARRHDRPRDPNRLGREIQVTRHCRPTQLQIALFNDHVVAIITENRQRRSIVGVQRSDRDPVVAVRAANHQRFVRIGELDPSPTADRQPIASG